MSAPRSTAAAAAPRARVAGALAGTRALTRLTLRRDRIPLPVWLCVLIATIAGTGASYAGLYDTAASRRDIVASIAGTPTLLALYGRLYSNSVGGLTAWKGGTIALVLAALMSLMTVIRNTRGDEEAGRTELVGAGAVSRQAPLAAALAVAGAASATLVAGSALALIAVGLPASGSLALGVGLGAAGCMFGALAAVTAQLSESARTARGLAIAALGAAYLLRAVGDAGPHWLSWLSPLGWCQQLRPYAGERWAVLLLPAAFTLALVLAALRLRARRDVGAGLLAPAPGPPRAAASLRSPGALAWRLERGSLAGWTAGFAIGGVALGSVASGIGKLVGDSAGVKDVLTKLGGRKGIADAYLAATFGVLGLVAAIFAVQAILALRSEEAAGRAEPLLATATTRTRWALGNVALAAAGTPVLLLAAGLPAGIAHALQTGDAHQLPRLLGAAVAPAPAAWVLAAVALALVGWAPRAAALGWAAVAACLVLDELGQELGLPQRLIDVSPFAHVPRLPGAALNAGPFWLAAIAVALGAFGLLGLRRRDVG
jgi:ABC-2 type transport system permease protein